MWRSSTSCVPTFCWYTMSRSAQIKIKGLRAGCQYALLPVFFFIASGVGLSSLYCGHFWPIVPAPMIGEGDVEQLVEWRLAGETEVLGENPPQRHFPTTNPTWPDPGSNPGCCQYEITMTYIQTLLVFQTSRIRHMFVWWFWEWAHVWAAEVKTFIHESPCICRPVVCVINLAFTLYWHDWLPEKNSDIQ
jgi:hypothetical protein